MIELGMDSSGSALKRLREMSIRLSRAQGNRLSFEFFDWSEK
jgi:hypothetical protein